MQEDQKKRPDIFRFHDYREFLKAWFAFLKATQRDFSLRSLAQSAQLSNGYLPMVLSGSRQLSQKALDKLEPELGLKKAELAYLQQLIVLGNTDSQATRLKTLSRMKRSLSYRKSNPKELEVYQYLTRWYYVAIRELALIGGFSEDPAWIRSRLKNKVSVPEIRQALAFLFEHGYLEKGSDGTIRLPEKQLDCLGGVYRVALTQWHREVFQLASASIENTPSEERQITGHTFGMSAKAIGQAREILAEALERIKALEASQTSKEEVYHLELALFPLSESAKKNKE